MGRGWIERPVAVAEGGWMLEEEGWGAWLSPCTNGGGGWLAGEGGCGVQAPALPAAGAPD